MFSLRYCNNIPRKAALVWVVNQIINFSWGGNVMSNEGSEFNSIGTSVANRAAVNAFGASVVEFVSRLFIEEALFQNSNIPHQSLLYLANDLIRILSPEKNVKFSIAKELTISYKQLRGQPLTEEEKKYEYSDTELDVVGEILNGVKYSTVALLGKNFIDSLVSTAQQGLWKHLPALAGYTGALVFGPQAMSATVDYVLAKSDLHNEQRELVRPWLNTVARLALGTVPKVHANESGVHYHYPSFSGNTETYTRNQSVRMQGEDVTVTRSREFITPEGKFPAEHSLQFKLHQIDCLSGQTIRIQVINQSGEKVPVEFHVSEGQHGPEIQVISTDPDLAEHWSAYFRAVPQFAGAISATPDNNYAELVSQAVREVPRNIMPQFINSQHAGSLMTLAFAALLSRQSQYKLLSAMLLASSGAATAAAHGIPDSVFQEHKDRQKALNELRQEMTVMFEDISTVSGAIPNPLISVPMGLVNTRAKQFVDDILKQDPKTSIMRRVLEKEFEDIRSRYGNGERESNVQNHLQSKLKATHHILEILNDPRIDIDDATLQLPTIVEFLRYQQDSTEALSSSYQTLSSDMQVQGRRVSLHASQLNEQGQKIAGHGEILTKVSGSLQGLAHSSAQSAHRISKVAERLVNVQKQGKLTGEDVKKLQEDLSELQKGVNQQHAQNQEQLHNIAGSQDELRVVNQYLFNQAVAVNTAGFEANREIMKLQEDLRHAQTRQDTNEIIAKNYALKQAISKETQRAIDVERTLNTLGDGFALIAIGAQFLGNAKLAHQISTVGQAAVTIGISIATLAGIGAAAAASGPLAPVVAIAGALLSVFSLFMDSGPTPEEMILEQLGILQGQLQRVRKEMHERFDHVEKMLVAHHEFTKAAFKGLGNMLDNLHKVMGHRFDHIEKMLIGVHKEMILRFIDAQINSQAIHVLAKSIDAKLGEVELKMSNGFKQLYNQNYQQSVRAALDYHSHPNVRAMSPEMLNDYYSVIKHFASQDSTNAIFSGDASSNTDAAVVNCLERGIENCINTFASYADANYRVGHFANLPNPVVWAEATSNLLEFILTMPEFNINAKVNDLNEVIMTGNNFVSFIKHIKTDKNLANGLLLKYREAIHAVKYALINVLAELQHKSSHVELENDVQRIVQSVLPPSIAARSYDLRQDASNAARDLRATHANFNNHVDGLDAIVQSTHANADGAHKIQGAVQKLSGTAIYNHADVTTGQSCDNNIPNLGRLTAYVAACYRWWWGGSNCNQIVPALNVANQVVEDVREVGNLINPFVTTANRLHNPISVKALSSGKQHHAALGRNVESVNHVSEAASALSVLTEKAREIYDKKLHVIDYLTEYLRHHIDPNLLADFNRRLLRDTETEGSVFHNALYRLRLAHGVLMAYISLGFNDELRTSYALQAKLQSLSMPITTILNGYNGGDRDSFLYIYLQNKLIPEFDSLVELLTEKVLASEDVNRNNGLNSGYYVVERSLRDLSFFRAAYSRQDAGMPRSANSNNEDFSCTDEECTRVPGGAKL
jgi:hypothetical protein